MKKLIVVLTMLVIKLVVCPLIMMGVWNRIAWEFNLPTFGFMVPFGICLVWDLMKSGVDIND